MAGTEDTSEQDLQRDQLWQASVETLYDSCCEEFAADTCENFARVSGDYAAVGLNLRDNLAMIQAGKVEEWLADQDRRWRCVACGRPIDCWEQECHWCGASQGEKRSKPLGRESA